MGWMNEKEYNLISDTGKRVFSFNTFAASYLNTQEL
jgi:hypothetical protein